MQALARVTLDLDGPGLESLDAILSLPFRNYARSWWLARRSRPHLNRDTVPLFRAFSSIVLLCNQQAYIHE